MTLVGPDPQQVEALVATGTERRLDAGEVAVGVRPSVDVWRRFRRNKLAMLGLIFIVVLVLAAIFAPLITSWSPTELDASRAKQGPSRAHWFGTDSIGRDVYSRVIYGARISLRVGIIATTMSIVIGVILGAIAGFFGGLWDGLMMRLTDIFLAIPYIILGIALGSVLGRSVNTVIWILGLTGWLVIVRVVRASFLQIREQEYVEAARALGYSRTRVMFRHILPNALQPIIVYAAIAIGGVILAEVALAFLGIGAVPPTPSWGLMIDDGASRIANEFHILFFPGLAVMLTVIVFVFVGDGLRDALDPKLRGRD